MASEGDRRRVGSGGRRLWQGVVALTLGALVVLRGPAGESGLPDPSVAGLLYLACVSGELCRVDLAELRLPDALTLPGFGFAGAGLVASWAQSSSALVCAAAVTAGGCAGAFFLLLHTAGGVGMGDVKLGALLGLAAGPLGGQVVVAGVVIAFVAAGAVAVAVLGVRGSAEPNRLPFGPFLLAGFWSSLALVAA